jgi:asparagine synthase (glutamine-hydrolysing)
MLVFLGLTLLQVDNALLLAVLAGMFEIIPLFGPILAAIPAVTIALISDGMTAALLVVGLYIIIQQFENQLIYPLGVFLSGGLDSSSIVHYAMKASAKPIHTFSIGFEEASFDESVYAKEVASYLGTSHHHKRLTAKDSFHVIPHVLEKLDEPMADASIVPTHLLSSFTKEHVTVALGGDGGDELFAGYPTFQAELAMGIYASLPSFVRERLLPRIVGAVPSSTNNFGLKFQAEKFMDGARERDITDRHMRWLGTFGAEEITTLLNKEFSRECLGIDPYRIAKGYYRESAPAEESNRLLFVYQRTYMMDEVLVKVDRASMYAALEVRAPFLDRALVEYANSLPYAYKLSGLTSKHLLKHLMRGRLPDHIIDRKKKGFGIPIGAWLRSDLRAWGEELLLSPASSLRAWVDPEYVGKLWEEHQSGAHDHRKKLWNLLVLSEWGRRFL